MKRSKFKKVYCICLGSLLVGVYKSFSKAYKDYLFLEKYYPNHYTFCSLSNDFKFRVIGGLIDV